MNIDKLERMIAVYEHGSFSKAAETLGMSQPALTISIRQLEDELNVRLFDRSPRGIQPTAMCEKLVSRARTIKREKDRFLADVFDGDRQFVTFGIHSALLNARFARCISDLPSSLPNVTLAVEEGYSPELIDRLRRGELDFAYCSLPPTAIDDESLHFEPVTQLTYAVVAESSHPIFEDMSRNGNKCYPWVVFKPGVSTAIFPSTDDVQTVLEHTGYRFANQEVRTSSMGLIRILVLQGGHIGMVPEQIIAGELASGHLKRLPQMELEAVRVGFVSIPGSIESPAAQKLKAALRNVVCDHSPQQAKNIASTA